MKILTVGDSFTYGEELSNLNDAWPHVLGRQIGYEVTNLGEPGSGNTRMVRNVIKNAPAHDLIVVAWSHWARTEFADEDGVFDIWPGYSSNFHAPHPWREDLIKYYSSHHNDSYLIEQFIINVLLTQTYLKSLNKRYVMLSAFGLKELKQYTGNEQLNLQMIDHAHYPGWPDTTMMEWAWKCPKGPRGHFLELGHSIVANKIYEHIRNLSWVS